MESSGIFSDDGNHAIFQGRGLNDKSTTVSVVENRAREVCISKIDSSNSSVIEIFIMSDTHSYMESLSTLQSIGPNEILLHDGSRDRVLTKKIIENFPVSENARILFISRQYFDQDKGADMLKKVLLKFSSCETQREISFQGYSRRDRC